MGRLVLINKYQQTLFWHTLTTTNNPYMTNNQHDLKWFVLMTRPRAEKQVGRGLSERSVENFVPLQRQLKQWHDRKKWVDVPIFNSYIFVRTSEIRRNEVFAVNGITRYLSIGGQVCTVTNSEIERIRRICSFAGKVNIEHGHLQRGDEVEIMDGHFTGLRGQLLATKSGNRIKISIESLSCFAIVELDRTNVQKIIA